MIPNPIVVEWDRLSSSSTIGVHGGVTGFMVDVIHLIFGVIVIVSMSGRPIPFSSLGEMSVVCAIGRCLWGLKNVYIVDDRLLMCCMVGVWM